MTGFEPWTIGVGSNHSTNSATTTALFYSCPLGPFSVYDCFLISSTKARFAVPRDQTWGSPKNGRLGRPLQFVAF